MSNASFSDGLIKVGMSSKDPIERKSELESSGVPEPFVIEYKALVDDYRKIETKIHRLLIKHRPNKKREFFTCSILEVIAAIRSVATISYEENNHNGFEGNNAGKQHKDKQSSDQRYKTRTSSKIDIAELKARKEMFERVSKGDPKEKAAKPKDQSQLSSKLNELYRRIAIFEKHKK